MEFLKNNARGIVIALLAVGVITVVSASSNDSDDNQADNQPEVSQVEANDAEAVDATNESTEPETTEEPSAYNADGERESAVIETSEDSYSTTARKGDNQTTLVRDIVSQYMDAKDTALSAEQMLYVETNLVKNLPKDDLIFVGEEVSVSTSSLESTVEAAGKLTDAQLALWAQYL